MKQAILLFFTILLLGFSTAPAMNPTKKPSKRSDFRFIGADYAEYRDSLAFKSVNELKEILKALIITQDNTFPNPSNTANLITVVAQEINKKTPNPIFSADDIEILNNLIRLNASKELDFDIPELIEWLLNRGMPVNTVTDITPGGDQTVPLLVAVRTRKKNIVELLLNYGADQNIRLKYAIMTTPDQTASPLEWATKHNYFDMVTILKQHTKPATPLPSSPASSEPITSTPISTAPSMVTGNPTISPSLSTPSTTKKPPITHKQAGKSFDPTGKSFQEVIEVIDAQWKSPAIPTEQLGTPSTSTPISSSSTSTSSGIATATSFSSTKATAQSLQWNITKGKIIATLISAGWIAALYRWWTGSSTVERQENVLVNNTGATIFIRGSQDAIAPNTTYALPESGILSITLDADQDEAHDLKIDMADYADDLEDSYLNLTIRKKWFSNWFTVPLSYAPYWIDKKQD